MKVLIKNNVKMGSFKPIENMLQRVSASKEDSDVAYFYDLVLLGEMVTKIVTSYMIANVCDDVDRNRYRFEYTLVHSDGMGDYALILNDLN